LQLLIFRQDAPLISPHTAQLAAEPYRASGLVLWRNAAVDSIQRRISLAFVCWSTQGLFMWCLHRWRGAMLSIPWWCTSSRACEI